MGEESLIEYTPRNRPLHILFIDDDATERAKSERTANVRLRVSATEGPAHIVLIWTDARRRRVILSF